MYTMRRNNYLAILLYLWCGVSVDANVASSVESGHDRRQNVAQEPDLINSISSNIHLPPKAFARKLADVPTPPTKGKGNSKGKGDAPSKGKGKGRSKMSKDGGSGDDDYEKGKGKKSGSLSPTRSPTISKGVTKGMDMGKGKGKGKGKGDSSGKGKGMGSSKDDKGKKSTKESKSSKAKPTSKPVQDVPTFAPTDPEPSTSPPTSAPTIITSPPTSSPTGSDFETFEYDPYEVFYTVDQSRFILPNEYIEMANVTTVYLQEYFTEEFENDTDVNFRSVLSLFVDDEFSFGDPVAVEFNTTLEFGPGRIPTDSELNLLIEEAYTGDNEAAYRQFLFDNLFSTNAFKETEETSFAFIEPSEEDVETQGTEDTTTQTTTTVEQSKESNTLVYVLGGAAAGVVAFVVFVFGINAYDRRQEEEERLRSGEKQSVSSQTDMDTASASASQWDSTTLASIRASKIRQHSFAPSSNGSTSDNIHGHEAGDGNLHFQHLAAADSYETSHGPELGDDDASEAEYFNDEIVESERFSDIPLSREAEDQLSQPVDRGVYS